jgi:hypothetical protein
VFVISTRGGFEPLITERIFYRVQGILDGRSQPKCLFAKARPEPDFR